MSPRCGFDSSSMQRATIISQLRCYLSRVNGDSMVANGMVTERFKPHRGDSMVAAFTFVFHTFEIKTVMSTTELQESIIQKILSTNDNELLNYLNQLLSDKEEKKTYTLDKEEKNMLAESGADYIAGQAISKKDVQATLYSRILAISDEESLSEMISLIDRKDKTIYHTTLKQKEAIKKGSEQISRGNYFTNEQVQKEIDEWLSKE